MLALLLVNSDEFRFVAAIALPCVADRRRLASDALQRYCNAILTNCNAIFDFQITLF